VDTDWQYDDPTPDVGEIKHLLRCSRPTRIEAVKKISALIDVLKKNAEDVIATVEQARKIADSLK
jgi:hypothetical protein